MCAGIPLDGAEFRRWFAEAERALESANVQADAGLHNWSCFAAEQSAQLAIKGFLHSLGRAPWGHDLIGLGAAAAEAGPPFPAELADRLRRLSRHYIPARDPDAHAGGPPGEHYGQADSSEAIMDASHVLSAVQGSWNQLNG